MASNANRVFNTYELLENIMIHLSMVELYALSSLNQTFRNITLRSEKVKSIMNFPRLPNTSTLEDLAIKDPYLWLQDLCHGRRLGDQDRARPEVCINPIIHHLCKRAKVQMMVRVEGPVFRLSINFHSDAKFVLRQQHCQVKVCANPDPLLAKTEEFLRLLEGPSGSFLMGSWMTNVPMDVECGVMGIGQTELEQLKWEAIVGKKEATLGKVITVLLEYLDVMRGAPIGMER